MIGRSLAALPTVFYTDSPIGGTVRFAACLSVVNLIATNYVS